MNARRPAAAADRDTVPMLDPAAVADEYAPLCEAMYLMMTADGDATDDEREVLRGALRNLSGDAVGRAEADALYAAAVRSAATDGRDARLRAVTEKLRAEKDRAEVAFVLAAAIAFADNAIADNENETLTAFAQALGIDDTRAETLLEDVERDLSRR